MPFASVFTGLPALEMPFASVVSCFVLAWGLVGCLFSLHRQKDGPRRGKGGECFPEIVGGGEGGQGVSLK